jgi:hypothetical protein
MKTHRRLAGLLALVGLLQFPALAHALPVLVTSRAALGGNDFIDWATFGPENTTVASGSSILSDSGAVSAEVSMPSGDFETKQQSTSWFGNFAPGDAVLFSVNSDGPINIAFNDPVYGAGAQIQLGWLDNNFYGYIIAYDAADAYLGGYSLSGVSNSNSDNSAIFVGLLDTSASIGRVQFYVETDSTNLPDHSLAINRLDLVTGATSVPEPGTLLLMGSGLAGLMLLRRRRRG